MGILDELISNNEQPILFIGSGMPIRYFKNFPSWLELLKHLWSRTHKTEEDMYSAMYEIRSNIISMSPGLTENEIDFRTNTKLAKNIEDTFNLGFAKNNITINDFSVKDAYETKISPFRKEIANYLINSEFNDEKTNERNQFKNLLFKARAIFTTNYDLLLEELVDGEFTVFNRQEDIFMSKIDYGEIYKVHGSVKSPNDIIITSDDYNKFWNHSVLISAKIISFLMDSPIVFMGYSLTDTNIASILRSFTESLDHEQRRALSKRIVYVSYKPDEATLIEYVKESEVLGTQLTVIETDDFGAIFDKLCLIDQGVPVSYVRQFKQHIRDLIIERGKAGSLKTLLISPTELDSPDLQNERLVIAIGNETVVFSYPSRNDYFKDYMKDTPSIPAAVALRYIAAQSLNTRLPFFKHLRGIVLEDTSLRADEILRIRQRVNNNRTIDRCRNSINQAHRQTFNSLVNITNLHSLPYKELDLISYNVENLDRNQVKAYIVEKLDSINHVEWKKLGTYIARLAVVWDILTNQT